MRLMSFVVGLSLALAPLAWPVAAPAQVICISNASPPPELPVYDQPPIPAPGYIWTPGYWAGGPYGYFWVPGTWVEPPEAGLLWTPGYWAWRDGIYIWTAGYWGPQVGFYGGIDYGFGYNGVGYEGGRWEHGALFYNHNVNNFGDVRIRNVYEKKVTVEPGASRVSFHGGSGGTIARPTSEQQRAAREHHIAAIPAQLQHERTASADKSLLASENHGRPAIAATAKPNEFRGKGVVAARDEKARVVPQSVKPGLAPGGKPSGSALVPPNANPQKTLEEKNRHEPPPVGNARPDHNPAPGNAVTPPPPQEVNREGKPPAPEVKPLPDLKPPPQGVTHERDVNHEAKPPTPEVKTHPELKPPPPPHESHVTPPAHVVAPTPPPPPRTSGPPPAHVVAPTPPPPPRASNVPPPHVAAPTPPPPPPPHPAPPPKPAPAPEKKPQ
ncbi:MAG: YXWGXW repeat-containing protein [Hyphomicrobiales bacterium]|nr:YXWGXW repeat-containing protein [Hyphomicrobiales bacterium]